MSTNTEQKEQKGPNLQALGFKNAMDVIDILGLVSVDGEPIINDDNAHLDPKLKTKIIMEYFHSNYNVQPSELPYVASIIKHKLKNGQLGWRKK